MSATKRVRALAGLLAGGLLLAACSGSEGGKWVGDYVTMNDFEAVRGWYDAGSLTRDHAHSGQYATFVSPAREYGITYDLPLGEASVHPLKGVAVEAWAYLPSPQATAALEVQVALPGEGNRMGFADRIALPEQVTEPNKWMRVRKEFIFPAGLPAEAHLRIFLWRGGSPETVYLDDLKVKALE